MNTVPLSSSTSTLDLTTPRYNTRFKYFADKDGALHLYEQMFASKSVFKSADDIDLDPPKEAQDKTGEYNPNNEQRARRRAKAKFTDYALATYELDTFVTLTISDTSLRYNHAAALKKLINWLNNQVQRKHLIYLLVPELHKDGALHFHALCNSSALTLTDSGTVLIPERKKPIKRTTAAKLNNNPDSWHTVFNVVDWKIGFTTAVFLYGSTSAAISYVSKYIQKTMNKIGGRYFYHGGAVRTPVTKLAFLSVNAIEDARNSFGTFDNDGTFTFTAAGCEYKVQRFPTDWR